MAKKKIASSKLEERQKTSKVDETVVDKLAQAIARQEGFYVHGSIPQRNHNPGNLRHGVGGSASKANGTAGGFATYASDEDGFEDLRRQVRMMLTGESSFYNPSMSIWDVAQTYTQTQQLEWATNVAKFYGVPVTTKLSDLA